MNPSAYVSECFPRLHAAFLNKHPGGKEMLLLSAGRECTALFNSYHWATDKPRKYMAAYEIGALFIV